jgi:hypothetical protein
MSVRVIAFIIVIGALIGYPLKEFIFYKPIKETSAGYLEVDLKGISLFPFDQQNGKQEDVPVDFRALDGKKVTVVGEMWQPYSATRAVDGFQLVYSISKCCMTGVPQIQHFVQAKVVPDKHVEYYSGSVRVTGTMHVKVTKDEDGKITGVYHMDVEDVQPM